MAMERLAEYLQERGRLGDNEMAEKLREHVKNVGDAPEEEVFPKGEQESSLLPVVRTEGQLVIVSPSGGALRTGEFQFAEHTPELIHALYSRFWERAGEQVGQKIRVPKPRFKQAELELAEGNGLSYLYMPPKFATPDALPTLAEIFPFAQGPYTYEKGAYHYIGQSLRNTSTQEGWITVESSHATPLINTDRDEVEAIIRGIGREGQTLNVYIVGSVVSKLLTNRFWDEGTFARLFCTLQEQDPIVATSRIGSGVLVVQSLSEVGEDEHIKVGARTKGITPTYGRAGDTRIKAEASARDRFYAIGRGFDQLDKSIGRSIFGRRG